MTTSLKLEFTIGSRSHHAQPELSQVKYLEQANFGSLTQNSTQISHQRERRFSDLVDSSIERPHQLRVVEIFFTAANEPTLASLLKVTSGQSKSGRKADQHRSV